MSLEGLNHLLQERKRPLQRVEVGVRSVAKDLGHVAGEHPLYRETRGHPAVGERQPETATVTRISQPPHVSALLEPVQQPGNDGRSDPQLPRELAGEGHTLSDEVQHGELAQAEILSAAVGLYRRGGPTLETRQQPQQAIGRIVRSARRIHVRLPIGLVLLSLA